MKVQVQVVTTNEDGQESIRELACIEREELTAEGLGLSIAESKMLLKSLQEIVVEWQMQTYLDTQRHCPDCGKLRHSKGSHHTARWLRVLHWAEQPQTLVSRGALR